jgi:hypothetical protein
MTNHTDYEQTIAAFIDGEPVAVERLRDALTRPGGREHLIDLIVLRQLVVSEPTGARCSSAFAPPARRGVWRPLAMAAALVLAVIGGYFAGSRAVRESGVAVVEAPQHAAAPPKPTVVVTVERWQDTQKGGGS